MILLEQTRECCECARVLAVAPVGLLRAVSPRPNRGGVGKPGGFTNTFDDPRAGGTVVLPGDCQHIFV